MPTWEQLRPLTEFPLYGNPLRQWGLAILVSLVTFVVLRLLKAIAVSRLKAVGERFQTGFAASIADVLNNTGVWFLFVMALFAGSLALALPPQTARVVHSVTIITLLIQAAIWGNAIVTVAVARYMRERLTIDAASVTTMAAVGFLGRLAIWSIAVLLALENLGVNVTALVAGLGIGGIAVALAAQNILGDLFASLSIVLDKPFVLGDFIIVGGDMGTVEQIGLKTTRLRSLSGEQLIFSNADLLKSRIRNFKRMQERRIVFSIGVIYQTPHEKLVAISQMLREAVEAQPKVRFDRAHLKEFGSSAINYEVVYIVLSADFNEYMDIQQAINLQIFQRFAEAEIEFAYPTQTLLVTDVTPGRSGAASQESARSPDSAHSAAEDGAEAAAP